MRGTECETEKELVFFYTAVIIIIVPVHVTTDELMVVDR